MAAKVWAYGFLVLFAFLIGNVCESGGRTTSAQVIVMIIIGAWSLGVWLVACGYQEGKRKR